MKLAVMQPYLFPYIGYFQLIAAVDTFLIYDDVNFIKKGWINRNRILHNGQPMGFTVPLANASQNSLIKDVEISKDGKWQAKLLKTIQHAYGKAPYFDEVFPIVENCLQLETDSISIMAVHSIKSVLKYIRVQTKVLESSVPYESSEFKGQERILHLCKKLNADTYLNPFSGHHLYDREVFEKSGVVLHFVESVAYDYRQFDKQFISNLSIIDVMMFNGPENTRKLVNLHQLH